ncbi:MAG TPA: glycoside hydrolase family 3 N-terminal domain-containing protein [Pyrinomonadaceae bacterium]|nr:glycoside hydrolase family 3 N-terminal domain-containing protein [Pyrinomonadaceae bacterium]
MLEKILSLPLEQKIGQLFFIGLAGTQIDDSARQLLEEISPGGVCLFARNIREAAQTRKLLDDVRAVLPVVPFLSLDQEGGLVDRLRRVVEPMPSANLLKTPKQVEDLARITAEIVRILGFNMNFAPVVDVMDEGRAKFVNGLFSRTFGTTKEEVFEFSRKYLATIQSNGVLGSIKHFPGLGATEVDSHEELPRVNLENEEFNSIDLYPYKEFFKTVEVHAVMIAHAAFPNLNLQERDQSGKLLPSSLSFNFTTKLLREHLGFDGLALTDDLEMGAILKNYGIAEACKMAVKAGQDSLLICNDANAIREGFSAVLNAVKSGEIEETRVNKSLQRVAAVKNLIQTPLDLNKDRLGELSNEISDLKARLK